jgi:hypothetical protein
VDLGVESDYPTAVERNSNPLVCLCEHPVADIGIDFGQCQRCGRKPLSLFLLSPS